MTVEIPSLEDLFASPSPPPSSETQPNEEPHRKSASPLKQGSDDFSQVPADAVTDVSRSDSPQFSVTQSSRHTPSHSPPRKVLGAEATQLLNQIDNQVIPIDPALLDVSVEPSSQDTHQIHNEAQIGSQAGDVQTIEGGKQEDYDLFATPPGAHFNLTADKLLHPSRPGDPFQYSLASIAPARASTHPSQESTGPIKTPWSLNTDLNEGYTDSQPASTTSTESPGLGEDGLYHGQPWAASSREGSMTDLGSYVGSNKGEATSASSESGYEPKVIIDGQKGVPPPRPKKSHARKQPEGHIKRARNAFILFRKHITDSNLIPPSVEVKHQNISVVAAKMWREAPQDVRQRFQEQARIEKEEHQRQYPGYRYQPVFRRTDIIRRRVRKDPAEDEKVDAVAELLIQGKSGGDLEQGIKEQMVALTEEAAEGGDKEKGDGQGREIVPPPQPMSRRRRREVGQLSKGAIRAQRAQARAKQMRQNLIGTNLLSMSMYNAAQQRAAAAAAAGNVMYPGYNMDLNLGGGEGGIAGMGVGGMPNHPGAQHYQYTMAGGNYIPMGYDIDGQAMSYDSQGGFYDQSSQGGGMMGGGLDAGDMYRLPPIGDLDAGPGGYGDGWQGHTHTDYWGQNPTYGAGGPAIGGGGGEGVDGMDYYAHPDGMDGYDNQGGYHLPPLIDPTDNHGLPGLVDFSHGSDQNHQQNYENGSDAGPSHNRSLRDMDDPWRHGLDHGHEQPGGPGDGQQTPSGHVMFNERLFDGALGSAGLGGLGDIGAGGLDLPGIGAGSGGRDDGMSGFEEAIAQANEVSQW